MVIIGIKQMLSGWGTRICYIQDPSDHGGAHIGGIFVSQLLKNLSM